MDVVIVCLYPGDTVDFVRNNAGNFKSGGIVIDTCGIKSEICSELNDIAAKTAFAYRCASYGGKREVRVWQQAKPTYLTQQALL